MAQEERTHSRKSFGPIDKKKAYALSKLDKQSISTSLFEIQNKKYKCQKKPIIYSGFLFMYQESDSLAMVLTSARKIED